MGGYSAARGSLDRYWSARAGRERYGVAVVEAVAAIATAIGVVEEVVVVAIVAAGASRDYRASFAGIAAAGTAAGRLRMQNAVHTGDY
jgi:hypothetical protein